MGDLLGYARISTSDQRLDLQIDALNAAGCIKVFTDRASGSRESRPQLDRLWDQLRPGDTVCVWRLDRLGRSLTHLIRLVDDLHNREVGFKSLTESIDTTTSGGRLIFAIFAALASYEREIIRERTVAGLAAARARGAVVGRKTVMTPARLKAAKRLLTDPENSVKSVAEAIGVSRQTLYRQVLKDGRPA